jgi:glycerol uptake facilitator-like aquaporin
MIFPEFGGSTDRPHGASRQAEGEAHFNPVVTLADAIQSGIPWHEVPAYLGAPVGEASSGLES